MIKILLIAPKCYPVNGAEAIVNIKLLRAMTEDGNFEIDLVSRRNIRIVYPSDSLESYGVKLHGLYIVDNKGGFSLRVLWESFLSLCIFKSAFPGCHWAVRALPVVRKLVKVNHYDFVLTKSSPSLLLASYLKKKIKLKWVASWNDPYPPSFYPIPYGKGCNHKPSIFDTLQIRLMRLADYHVFPSRALKDHMTKYLKIPKDICMEVPHVVFENHVSYSETKKDNSKNCLRIIHSGNLSSPRNPIPFIHAFKRIIVENPKEKIHLTLLGKVEQADKEYIQSIEELKNHIDILLTVEYKKSLEMLYDHDLACVIEADCGVGGGVFLPTKITDFMQMHKPIIAVSPRAGVLEELFKEGAIGYFADVHDEESIYSCLIMVLSDYKNGTLKNSYIPSTFQPESVVSVYKEIASLI